MSEIINFNKKRKAKARADDQQQAAANRAKFGRTKNEKLREQRRVEELTKHLDRHKRETDEE